MSRVEESDWLLARTCAHKEATEEELGLLALLIQQSREGHLCIHVENETLVNHPLVQKSGNRLYFQKNWEIETRIVQQLQRLLRFPKKEALQTAPCSSLTEEQAHAVNQALSSPLSLITGGPGTGKTYTAAHIVKAMLEQNPQSYIFLGAPTGKAAANLERGLSQLGIHGENVRFGTLHKFLGVDPSTALRETRTPHIEDLILIDEASMIDARLFSELLGAVREDAHLVLMGDAYQLPPVESGSIFADLVEILTMNLTELTKSKRTDQEKLLTLATTIRQGSPDDALVQLQSHMLKEPWLEYVLDKLIFPLQGPINEEMLFATIDTFRLLSCMREGAHGVDQINQKIQSVLLETMEEGSVLPLPILITKNHPATGLYNGDTGILIRHSKEGICHKDYVLFKNKSRLPALTLPSHELGYCITVHKSQGSEYNEVLLFVPKGSEVFGKELLYTAVTRARTSFQLHADEETLLPLLSKNSKKRSGICERLTRYCS